MRLGVFNLLKDSAQLSANSENAMFPVGNLVKLNTFNEYRSLDDVTESTINIDLRYAARVDSLFLCGNNVTGELNLTRIVIKGHATDFEHAWEEPLFEKSVDLDVSQLKNNFLFVNLSELDEHQAYRYWRLEVSNPAGKYVGFSNLFIGCSKLISTLQADNGIKYEPKSLTKVEYGRYGQPFIDIIHTIKNFALSFSVLATEEYRDLNEMIEYVDVHRPIWLVMDETSQDLATDMELFAGYFLLDDVPKQQNTFHSLYDTTLDLREII